MILGLFFTFMLILATPSISVGQELVGFVLEMQGKWFLDGSPPRKIHKGSTLPAGGSIYIQPPVSRSARVVVADRTGAIIVKKECDLTGECEGRIRLPGLNPGASSVGRHVSAVLDVLSKEEPVKYESFISSSSQLPEGDLTADDVREAVVAIRGDTLDMRPVFARVRRKRFFLRLNAAPGKQSVDHSPDVAPTVYDWDPAAPSAFKAPGIQPGLYEIERLAEGEGGFATAGVIAWILIPQPDEYEKVSYCFGKVVQVATKWGGAIKPDTTRTYLRANLDYLFTEGARCAE